MYYIADLHIHSHFSRATAKMMNIENIYIAAQQKGVSVISTGDMTHPGWMKEIKEKLKPDGKGFFKLKKERQAVCDKQVPQTCLRQVRFILGSEISNIYRKNGKVRKNHNLVFFPDIRSTERFNRKLEKIGNIYSDGRPILGFDARDLLELVLEINPKGVLIPAHIWTPWFSLFGSRSGFDSIEACFEDLSEYIFAVETGLSSNPAMNRKFVGLNSLTLISNSDAHSPSNIGREANLLNTERSYQGLWLAVRGGNPEKFIETNEFYPQQGKYFLDGHRKCGIRLYPSETRRLNGICPRCGKKLTFGVLSRIEDLSGREKTSKKSKTPQFRHSIQLENILAEILNLGSKTKTVQHYYLKALKQFGCEFNILHVLPVEKIRQFELPLLADSIMHMRNNEAQIIPGYDGEYGKVKLLKN